MFSRQRTGCLRNANRQRAGSVLDEPVHHPTGLAALKLASDHGNFPILPDAQYNRIQG